MRKILLAIIAGFASLALALAALPAQAVPPTDGIVTNADGSKTETKSVLDGGDIKYTISVRLIHG